MNFWSDTRPRTSEEDRVGASEAELKAFEESTNLKLPAELADLLRVQNGGSPAETDFKVSGDTFSLDDWFGLKRSAEGWGLMTLAEMLRSWGGEAGGDNQEFDRVLVFAGDESGHGFYGLDYRAEHLPRPKIFRIETEGGIWISPVADSFSRLLSSQYFGDSNPDIDFESWEPGVKFLEFSVRGLHWISKESVEIAHRVLLADEEITIRSKTTVGSQVSYEEWVVPRSSLCGLKVEKHSWVSDPPASTLYLHIVPSKAWVMNRSSRLRGSKWKNRSGAIVYGEIDSSNPAALEAFVANIRTAWSI